MAPLQQASVRNRLLAALPPDDFALLRGLLEPVALELRDVLIAPDEAIAHVYFPESGFGSAVAASGDERVEVGVIGREGFVGAPIVLGRDSSPHEVFIQGAGEALRIGADDLRQVLRDSPALHHLLLGSVHVSMVQTAQTAFANAIYAIDARLARWLLMCQDRGEGDELFLTHDFLAIMLGVRRPGVTSALHVLEGNRLIRARRGRITIRDRERLEELADGSYGVPEREYDRFIGEERRRLSTS